MLSSSDEDDAHKKTAATNRSLLRKANYHHQLSPKPSSEGAVSKHRAAAAAAAAMSDPCGDIGDGKITLVVDDTRFTCLNIHLRLFLTFLTQVCRGPGSLHQNARDDARQNVQLRLRLPSQFQVGSKRRIVL